MNPTDEIRKRVAAEPAAVTDSELLAALAGGRGEYPAVELEALACMGVREIAATYGARRAPIIMAALELGRRTAGSRPRRGRRLAAAADVWGHMRARLAFSPVEEFWSIALDVRHRVQSERCVARGSLTGVDVHPRDVFRPLIRESAAAVIFCHNHPSGDPSPSRQDLDITQRLREVGNVCGIAVLDHVVVASEGYASISERGWT
jgi:DNA repair protein RadC